MYENTVYVCEGWVIAVKPHFHSTVHRDEMRYEPTEECMVGSKQAVMQVTFTPNNAGAYAGATPGKPVACQHRLNARAQQSPPLSIYSPRRWELCQSPGSIDTPRLASLRDGRSRRALPLIISESTARAQLEFYWMMHRARTRSDVVLRSGHD